MTETTVTVGDTEVQITETEDGFEATPVEEEGSGLYIRAVSSGGGFGFEIPIEQAGNLVVEYREGAGANPYRTAWDTSVDESEMKSNGSGSGLAIRNGLDGHALLETVEIVER